MDTKEITVNIKTSTITLVTAEQFEVGMSFLEEDFESQVVLLDMRIASELQQTILGNGSTGVNTGVIEEALLMAECCGMLEGPPHDGTIKMVGKHEQSWYHKGRW